eukprot:4272413-Prymnesium_polylepis.1
MRPSAPRHEAQLTPRASSTAAGVRRRLPFVWGSVARRLWRLLSLIRPQFPRQGFLATGMCDACQRTSHARAPPTVRTAVVPRVGSRRDYPDIALAVHTLYRATGYNPEIRELRLRLTRSCTRAILRTSAAR